MVRQTSTKGAPSFSELIAEMVIHLITVWRVELFMLAIPVGLGSWVYLRAGLLRGILCVTLVVLLGVLPPSLRHELARILHRSSVRRHLDIAFENSPGILSERPPAISKVIRSNVGDKVALTLAHGTSIDDMVKAESVIASSLRVRDVQVIGDSSRKNQLTLSIIRRDPFEGASLPSPMLTTLRMSAWDPIPVGIDEQGDVVTICLPENNLLIGGLPNSGKSVSLSQIVGGFALDPTVDLWLFDGKLVELASWRSCARRFVGPDIELAISVLEEIQAEMAARYETHLANKVRKVCQGDGLSLHVVVIDELALYVAGVDKKLASRFAELLRDLVARGRAAGVIVVAATQKPSIDIVPSSLRDLFGFRWALRCATREASDTVLGSGWASQGYSAADIDAAGRGVGLLLYEGGVPVRLRSFYLSDSDVEAISMRAIELRNNYSHSLKESGQ